MNKLLIIYLITWGVLVPWAGCEVIKLTLEIPAGKENCFSEILNEKASYKFEYRLLNSDEIRGDDSVVSVSATDEYERSKLFGSNERHASHSFKSKGNGQMIHFCASNRLESKAVKVYFQLSTGIDINDFERLPLDVGRRNRRTRTSRCRRRWRSSSR
jgi:hypothetical protein